MQRNAKKLRRRDAQCMLRDKFGAALVIAAVIFLNLPKVVVVLTAEAGATMILSGFLLAIGQISLASMYWGVVDAFIRACWLWLLVFLSSWERASPYNSSSARNIRLRRTRSSDHRAKRRARWHMRGRRRALSLCLLNDPLVAAIHRNLRSGGFGKEGAAQLRG